MTTTGRQSTKGYGHWATVDAEERNGAMALLQVYLAGGKPGVAGLMGYEADWSILPIQAIMRHSSITLTMDTYGHLFPGQEADTVARLPGMLGNGQKALRATGTADYTAEGAQR